MLGRNKERKVDDGEIKIEKESEREKGGLIKKRDRGGGEREGARGG